MEELDGNLNPPPPDLPLLHHLKLSLLRQRLVRFESGKMAAAAAAGLNFQLQSARLPGAAKCSEEASETSTGPARAPEGAQAGRAGRRRKWLITSIQWRRQDAGVGSAAPSLCLHHRHWGPVWGRPGPGDGGEGERRSWAAAPGPWRPSPAAAPALRTREDTPGVLLPPAVPLLSSALQKPFGSATRKLPWEVRLHPSSRHHGAHRRWPASGLGGQTS